MTFSAPPPGVFTPVPTFFKSSGPSGRQELDIDTQIKHAVHLAENGVKGAVILGSTGEMIHLTREERHAVVAGTIKGLKAQGHSDFLIYAGVAQNSVEDTLEDIKSLKNAGATVAMALAPNYFAPSTSQAGLLTWFNAVADESVLPIVIYYYPGVSNGLNIKVSTLAKLSEHPNIVGVKLSHGNVSEYAQLALDPKVQGNNFSVFTGLGQVLLPAISVGVTGTIDAMSGAFPKIVVKLFDLSIAGNFKEAQKLQYVLSRVEEIVVAFGPVGVKHTIKAVLGLGNGEGRAPLNEVLSASQSQPFTQAIQDAVALEKSL